MDDKQCCFTGYRPQKFPFKLSKSDINYNAFENSLFCTLQELISAGYRTFYSGMAMGFDIIAAEHILMFKELFPQKEIKLVAVLPFAEQSSGFSDEWKKRHTEILKKADDIIVLSDSYFVGCYNKRNCFMVERSDTVVTWFDGKSGGTKNTLCYASKLMRKIINLNEKAEFDYSDYEVFSIVEDDELQII